MTVTKDYLTKELFMYIILLIPKVIAKPIFNLTDKDGIERELTKDEAIQLQDYESRLDNWNKFSDIINKWPVNGDYKDIVSYKKAPIVKKGDDEFMIFTLPLSRLDDKAILSKTDFNSLEETVYIEADNIDEKLSVLEFSKTISVEKL